MHGVRPRSAKAKRYLDGIEEAKQAAENAIAQLRRAEFERTGADDETRARILRVLGRR